MRRTITVFCAVLSLIAALAAPAAAETLSPRAFTRAYVETLREAQPGSKARIDGDLAIVLLTPGGEEHNVFLDNAFREYHETPHRLDEIIRHHVAGIRSISDGDFSVKRSEIVPIVKDRAWVGEVASTSGQRQIVPLTEPLNDELVIVYAVDQPRAVRFLVVDDLGKEGLKRSELKALAIRNLRERLPPVQLKKHEQFLAMSVDGFFEASLLLLPELWSAESLDVDGEIVIAVPSRQYLLIVGSDDRKAVADLRRLAALIVSQAPYALTEQLFVYRDGSFQPFDE